MPDYNINFKGKTGGMSGGVGKRGGLEGVMSARAKAIEASKKGSSGDNSSKLIETQKLLAKGIDALTKEIKVLQSVIKANKSFGGGGGSNNRMSFGGGGSGLSGIGSTIPFAGAMMAGAGFIMDRVNLIGNAYLEKSSEQLGNTGTTGFRRSQGLYNATEMGVGMKAYGESSGRFTNGVSNASVEDALKIGSIYGLSSEEVLGAEGTFKRSNSSYAEMATTALGGGVETQLPTMMSAMASEMEDAIKNGFDASDMGKTISEKMTAITMSSRSKDARFAVAVTQAASGAKANASRGTISSAQDIFAWKAGQNKLVEQFNDNTFIENEVKQGRIGKEKADKLSALKASKGSLDRRDIESTLGGTMTTAYTEDAVSSMSLADIQQEAMKQMIKMYNPKGTRPKDELLAAIKLNANSMGVDFGGNAGVEAVFNSLNERPNAKKGEAIASTLDQKLKSSPATWSRENSIKRGDFVLDNGRDFAQATLDVEDALRTMAEAGISGTTKSLQTLSSAITSAAKLSEEGFGKASKAIGEFTDAISKATESMSSSVKKGFHNAKESVSKLFQ